MRAGFVLVDAIGPVSLPSLGGIGARWFGGVRGFVRAALSGLPRDGPALLRPAQGGGVRWQRKLQGVISGRVELGLEQGDQCPVSRIVKGHWCGSHGMVEELVAEAVDRQDPHTGGQIPRGLRRSRGSGFAVRRVVSSCSVMPSLTPIARWRGIVQASLADRAVNSPVSRTTVGPIRAGWARLRCRAGG